jgi:Uma2 family endonuclease
MEVDVPDLAGWRPERMPQLPLGHRSSVVPDWVCEVHSRSSASIDREIKMPIYARFGVAYCWLIDPLARTLHAYTLAEGAWPEIGCFVGSDRVAVARCDAVTIQLDDLWAPR